MGRRLRRLIGDVISRVNKETLEDVIGAVCIFASMFILLLVF